MVSFQRSSIPGLDEASDDLPGLRKELTAAEKERTAATEKIRRLRQRAEGRDSIIPPGSPSDRSLYPTGLKKAERAEFDQAREQRQTAAARIEELQKAIRDAESAARRKICGDIRPDYLTALRAFWAAYLARREGEFLTIAAMDAIRNELESKGIRPIGLSLPRTVKNAGEEAVDLRKELKELLEAGDLERKDIPKSLATAWRL